MKAKELLKEIVKAYPDVVAIAQDEEGFVYTYFNIPEVSVGKNFWDDGRYAELFSHTAIIEWDSENWKENIVTINDLKKMKAIEALKQINAIFPNYIAIAKDKINDGQVYAYETLNVDANQVNGYWYFSSFGKKDLIANRLSPDFASKIEWDSEDWTKCIVTLNDIQDEEL